MAVSLSLSPIKFIYYFSSTDLWGIPLLSHLLFFMDFTKRSIAIEKYLMLISKGAGGRVLFYYENNNGLPSVGDRSLFYGNNFYMSVSFLWLWFTLCNDKMILICKWQSYTDLLLIICRFILGKTVVLKWVTDFSFWNDFVAVVSDDFMPFILKWAKVFIALKCLDCLPSCQPQNDNNFLVIYKGKFDALKLRKIIKKRASFFALSKGQKI